MPPMAVRSKSRRPLWVALLVSFSVSLACCFVLRRAMDTRHHVEIRNATDQSLEGFRLALDNDPFFLDAPTIAAQQSYAFDFTRNRETGYVFSLPSESNRVEIGRCGYTSPGLNSYIVTISAPSHLGFACEDVTPPHNFP
jgi:hypothetical protein